MIAKPSSPKFNLVEHIAAEMAGVFYETGRSQGLTPIQIMAALNGTSNTQGLANFKNARVFAMNNLEKFVPHAVKAMLDMLSSSTVSAEQKEQIFESLQERINDPTAQSLANASSQHALPDIDVAKLIPVQDLPTVIKDRRVGREFGINPFFAGKRKNDLH